MTPSAYTSLGQKLFHSSQGICIICTTDGTILELNPTAQKLLEGDASLKGSPFQRILFGPAAEQSITEHRTPNGNSCRLTFCTTALLPETFNCFFFDVEEKIIVWGEMNVDDYSKMEATIIRTTSQLGTLNREIARQNAKLEQIIGERNKLLGITAHDMRSPVANIQSIITLLLDHESEHLGPNGKQLLPIAQQECSSMLMLMQDLLDFSSIDAGQMRLTPVPCSLPKLIQQFLPALRMRGHTKDIDINYSKQDAETLIRIDTMRFKQVLENLIGNAIKFSKRNTTIHITLSYDDASSILTIRDEGQGIANNELTNIFEPFTRSSTVPTEGESSTGLGLAIVRKIIESHNGLISVSSVQGQGTTFTIHLPLDKHL